MMVTCPFVDRDVTKGFEKARGMQLTHRSPRAAGSIDDPGGLCVGQKTADRQCSGSPIIDHMGS